MMKNAIMLIALFCCVYNTHGQTIQIKINDQISLQPISWVYLSFDMNSKPFIYSNDDGEISIELNELKKHDLFYFYHPHYKSQQLNLNQLIDLNYNVSMTENVNSLDEIVVSASKFNEKKSDVSQKIQVIRSSEMNFMNQSSTADIIANTGNIMVQKSQLGGGSPIIRGFETNKVLLVIDGVRMNNAIYRGGHLQNVLTLDNAIMDRVEVVYGPGSVVYGSDALGGVMSFTTKDPSLSSNDKLLVKGGAYTRYMSAVSGYAAHADVSVGSRKFGSLTSFTFSNFGDLKQGANREPFVGNFGSRPWYVERIGDKDSIFVNADTNLQVGSGYSQYDILQKFTFVPNSMIKHTLNFQFSNSSNVDRYDRLTLMSGSKPKFAEWYYGPQKRLFGSYSINLSGSNLFYDNAKLILAYQQIDESRIDRRFNQDSRNNRIENLDIFSLNIDLAKYKGNHEFRYGIEGWYNGVVSSAFCEDIITGVISPLDTRYASGGASMKSIALYATHTWEINDKFILNDGLRFSNVGLNARFTDTTFFKFPFSEANQNNSALNGNLGLIYSPDSSFRLTGLISTGFRAPNVDDLSKVFESTPGNLIIPNDNLKPEYTYNAELGMSSILNSWLTLQATGYYSLYRNAITVGNAKLNGKDSIEYEGVMSKVVSAVNARNAYLYGLELAMNASINKNISIYGTFNYTYARIVTDTTAIPLDHIPPTFGKLGLQISEKGFRGDLFVQYSGWKRIEDYNPFGEDNQAYALPEGMPSWYTVNLRIGYQFNKFLNLQVACENILDRNYRVFASNISAPGRNFIVTLRGNF
jgi:hemoglobin/transferrin/lactoferrin receptor protein